MSPLAAFDRRNLLTYASLGAALIAIAAARAGRADVAGASLALAVIADTFDGRYARRFGSDAQRCALGSQLDSLVDAVAFGVTPIVCGSLLSPAGGLVSTAIWWIAGFAYVACAVARLGFYNLTAAEGRGFIGVPAPVAALVWATALLARPTPIASALLLFACGIAMVVPLRIPRPVGARLAAFVAWPAMLVVAHLAMA